MRGCSAPNCTNRTENGKAFFSIPRGSSPAVVHRRLQWLRSMKREVPAARDARICEDHFTDDQFERYVVNGRRKLKCNAVPSIFTSTKRPKESEESAAASKSVTSNHEEAEVHYVLQDDSVASSDSTEEGNSVPSDSAMQQRDCAALGHSVAPDDSAPSENSLQPTATHAPTQVYPVAAVEQPATVVLQSIGAPTPTYAVTYVIPNHGAYALASHVALPASCALPAEESYKPPSAPSQSTLALLESFRKAAKTKREKELERMLDLERKKRRRAERERDQLRHSLKRLLADDQVRALEKGTMRGSSWSRETIQKALQLKVMCGGRVYDYVKSYVVPLPSLRTLQKLVEEMQAADGELLEEMQSADGELVEEVQIAESD